MNPSAVAVPVDARCLECEYPLRDLANPVCPECGRSFDATDPSTYDTHRWNLRRRLWTRRIAWTLVIMVSWFVIGPRGLMRGQMSFTCASCGHKTTSYRWQLRPPPWVPLCYPGLGITRSTQAAPSSCGHFAYRVKLQFDHGDRCSAGATNTYLGKDIFTFNGQAVTPATGQRWLKDWMTPETNGISTP